MEQRLKGLKKAMNNHTFQQVKFTEDIRHNINQQIAQIEEIDLASIILPLLTGAKTGFEITQLLHIRGIKSIINNEGTVYSILHEQEQKGTIESYWSQTDEKYYLLTQKGQKALQKQQQQERRENILKQHFNEVTPNEN